MEKTKTPSISGSTRAASVFLIVVGFINFTSAMDALQEQANLGVAMLEKFISIGALAWSIIAFISGWYLTKRRKWAYILSIISVLSLIAFTASIVNIVPAAYISLGLALFVFFTLNHRKKRFHKPITKLWFIAKHHICKNVS